MASVLKSQISLTPLSEVVGARVTGVDISKPLDAETVSYLTQAWQDHIVLIFPDLREIFCL